jgi:tRNA threonylcarbamoyladenosine biosynthesis protein TsaB
LYKDGSIIDSINLDLGKDLSSKALSLIHEMFKKNNYFFNDLSKIIVVNGPGSFTGVRVGLTIAKVIAWSIDIPITTISSLEAMAYSVDDKYNYVVPVIDARRGFYYGAIYDSVNKGFILKEQYINNDLLVASMNSFPSDLVITTNDKYESEHDIIPYKPDYLKIIEMVKDREPIQVDLVDANYLKKTEAEENRHDS